MIKTKAQAVIDDQEGVNNITFDVNYNPKRKDLIKVTLANKISVIKKDDLWNFVFTIVQTSQQQRMIPVVKTEMIRYQKQHEIRLQKDMKAGEIVVAHCAVNVEEEIDKAFRREIEEKKLSTPIPYLTGKKDSV